MGDTVCVPVFILYSHIFNLTCITGSRDQYTLCACNARYIAFHERASKVLSSYHYVSIRAQEKILKLSLGWYV